MEVTQTSYENEKFWDVVNAMVRSDFLEKKVRQSIGSNLEEYGDLKMNRSHLGFLIMVKTLKGFRFSRKAAASSTGQDSSSFRLCNVVGACSETSFEVVENILKIPLLRDIVEFCTFKLEEAPNREPIEIYETAQIVAELCRRFRENYNARSTIVHFCRDLDFSKSLKDKKYFLSSMLKKIFGQSFCVIESEASNIVEALGRGKLDEALKIAMKQFSCSDHFKSTSYFSKILKLSILNMDYCNYIAYLQKRKQQKRKRARPEPVATNSNSATTNTAATTATAETIDNPHSATRQKN
eukprot:CAMPEP_0115002482 /NCGR_PEP_ID=MMETSP0216-20121206/18029_1 /TAXON_ID=223996 /ORGANISM="Protocruzia adherens, Strain Boccale" /LENGTH=295 /DNA_ID=CAMNT_0002368079 /DNA_START=204 /DNA_END=1091 /DNA_ORIENTATION=+